MSATQAILCKPPSKPALLKPTSSWTVKTNYNIVIVQAFATSPLLHCIEDSSGKRRANHSTQSLNIETFRVLLSHSYTLAEQIATMQTVASCNGKAVGAHHWEITQWGLTGCFRFLDLGTPVREPWLLSIPLRSSSTESLHCACHKHATSSIAKTSQGFGELTSHHQPRTALIARKPGQQLGGSATLQTLTSIRSLSRCCWGRSFTLSLSLSNSASNSTADCVLSTSQRGDSSALEPTHSSPSVCEVSESCPHRRGLT